MKLLNTFLTSVLAASVSWASGQAAAIASAEPITTWQPPAGWTPVAPHQEQRGNITIIWLAGTPYEMGKQQGEMLGEIIASGLGRDVLDTLDFFGRVFGFAFLAQRRSPPEIVDECRGLSDAAGELGFTMEACMMLAFGDVYQEAFGYALPQVLFHEGCSSFIVTSPATADGQLYHGHTLDSGVPFDHLIQNPTLVIRQPVGAIPSVSIFSPGSVVPVQAMNAAGISVSINTTRPRDFDDLSLQGGSNVQMMARIMNEATSFDEAVAILTSIERLRANNITIADGNNRQGGTVELLGTEYEVRGLENGFHFATNHFASEAFFGRDAPSGEGKSSFSRFARYEQLLPPEGQDSLFGQFTPEVAIAVLRDRVNPKTGEVTPLDVWDDDASIGGNGSMRQVVFQPETGLFWVATGVEAPVPEFPFACFSLKELLGFPNAPTCPAPQID